MKNILVVAFFSALVFLGAFLYSYTKRSAQTAAHPGSSDIAADVRDALQ